MNVTLPDELAILPKPEIIEELDFEDILKRMIGKLRANYQSAGLSYTVERLRYDPQIIQLETASFSEMLLRQRINEAVRSQMLPFAYGGDLDILAAFYDVSRMFNETDERLRMRIVLAIQGRSTGGTEPRYKFIAMSADVRVADAVIYTIGRDPTIHVAIFSTDLNGVADPHLIEKVQTALQQPTVRMVNDSIKVASAAQNVIHIEADIWLLPQSPQTIIAAAEKSLRDAWSKSMALGRDLTVAWWVSKLMIDGIHRVEPITPVNNVAMPFNQAAAIGSITLNYRGRDH